MSTTATVRGLDPNDKSRLEREARRLGISMEEVVRRLLREERERTERRARPCEAFRRHFEPEHGVEFPRPRATAIGRSSSPKHQRQNG